MLELSVSVECQLKLIFKKKDDPRDIYWMVMVQNRERYRVLVNALMNLRVP
jgi:hypothetical protein